MTRQKSFYLSICSLLALCNTLFLDANTIIVDLNGTYTTIQSAIGASGSGDTILLTAGQTFTGDGNKNIDIASTDLTFGRTGDGADPIIDMEGSSISPARLFTIESTATVAMSDLHIRNGNVQGSFINRGGALNNLGSLTAFSCTFSGNTANEGGAIYNVGTVSASDCTCRYNTASLGGAIDNKGTLNALDCTFTDNSAPSGEGGAIINYDTMISAGCTFSSNTAVIGGAIANSGAEVSCTLTVTGCLFSHNSAFAAGAISNAGLGDTATLNIYNCLFDSNSAGFFAGAIYNDGNNGTATLNIASCAFSYNSADQAGGVIYNSDDSGSAYFDAASCNFIDNSTTNSGGVIYTDSALTSTVGCCRFVGNIAPVSGPAIYINSGSVYAIDNWWGSNADPSLSGLFGGAGSIISAPWILMAIQASPSNLLPGIVSNITADFTQNSSGQPIGSCMPDGSPVAFSTPAGTVTPPIVLTISGQAKTLLSLTSTASVCARDADAPDTTLSEQCTAATFDPLGLYRLNYGCICSDTTGTQHILVGSYNNTGLNSIEGWVFDEVTASCVQISPLIVTPDILYNVAVYNNADIINLAVLTTTSNSYTLSLATCSFNGVNYVIDPAGTPTTLPAAAFKVQWAVAGANAYIAVDTIDNMRVYPVDLSSYTIGTPIQTPNMGNNQYASDFLYWLYKDSSLYLIQGFNNTNIATYQVDLTGTPTIYPGVLTDVSSTFSLINSCATCQDYFVVGGSTAGQGTLAQYDVNISGTLTLIGQYTTPAGTTVNYCERCCCQESQLLVGTDVGLFNYSIALDDSLTLTSSLTLPVSGSTNWLSVCWCCNNSNKYCAAVNNAPSAFVLEQMTPTFTTQCSLE